MRVLIVLFLGLVLWGSASFAAQEAGASKWFAAFGLATIGVILQVTYARLVNQSLDITAMPESVRARLRSDRGVVPFWIVCVGMAARAFLAGGILMPLLEAAGCFIRGSA